jgi:hypothetical protein
MLDRRVEIIKTLRAAPVVLRALVHGVDDVGLRRRPAAGEWAIIEVVGHLADDLATGARPGPPDAGRGQAPA